MGAIAAGVMTLFAVRFGLAGRYVWLDPTLAGLTVAAVVFALLAALGGGQNQRDN